MRIRVYPYKMASKSSKVLSRALSALRVYPERRYKPRRGDLIINWGSSTTPLWYDAYNRLQSLTEVILINKPEAVARASNKLTTLRILRDAGVNIPEFTTDWNVASDWDEDGWTGNVFVRNKLKGKGGDGIEIYTHEQALPRAPLYVKGIEKRAEYRVHVFNGEVISYAKKRRRREDPPNEGQELVRSHDNGWIFTRDNLRRLERVEQLAIDAVNALGLDFGGVDIVRDTNNVCFVLEVNTACGLEGQTLQAYIDAINKIQYANRNI